MKLRHSLSALAGAVVLGTLSMGAVQAAPLGGAATGVNAGSAADSLVQNVDRRCWRHRGHWHCRRYGDYSYGDRYYYNEPYGYGPGFSFYFGGGHRHGHHHRHHRH